MVRQPIGRQMIWIEITTKPINERFQSWPMSSMLNVFERLVCLQVISCLHADLLHLRFAPTSSKRWLTFSACPIRTTLMPFLGIITKHQDTSTWYYCSFFLQNRTHNNLVLVSASPLVYVFDQGAPRGLQQCYPRQRCLTWSQLFLNVYLFNLSRGFPCYCLKHDIIFPPSVLLTKLRLCKSV